MRCETAAAKDAPVQALGWGFEVNVGKMKSQLERNGMERKIYMTLNGVARFDHWHRAQGQSRRRSAL